MAAAESNLQRHIMSAKRKQFIVLCVGDKDSYGYDENTLPLLLQIVDSSNPSGRVFTHTGVVGYYQSSRRALARVEEVLSRVERLRDSDTRFNSLGIGLAHGDLIADFDWFGRLKRGFKPMGEAANRAFVGAYGGVKNELQYKKVLGELRKTFR
jgi:hypothetical protein